MRQAIEQYLEALKVRRYSASTLRLHARSLAMFEQFLAGRGLDDERGRHPANHPRLSNGDHALHPLHRASVRLISLRRFFEHLEITDAILVNPCVGLKLPHLPQKLPKAVLTPGEARAVLDAPDTQTRTGIRDKAILEMFYSTGIRSGEMASLTVHDVDYRHGFVRVHKGKGGKDRVAPMGKKACDYVREYLQKVRSVWTKKNRDERDLWISAIEPHGPDEAAGH